MVVSIGAEYETWTMLAPQFCTKSYLRGLLKKEDGLGIVGIRGSKSKLTPWYRQSKIGGGRPFNLQVLADSITATTPWIACDLRSVKCNRCPKGRWIQNSKGFDSLPVCEKN